MQLLAQRVVATSTPGRLSALRAGCIVLAVVFAVAGAFGVNRRAHAIHDVRTAASQLLALQDIRVSVVHADAIASSSYLRSGQEDPAQRTEYLSEIAKAGDGLVAVSGAASSTDVAQLSAASRLLGSYVGLVEQARANNRQGFPIGAAYQRQANDIVSNNDPQSPDIESSLRAVEASQRDQINRALATAHRAGAWLHLSGWLLVLALLGASLWLARTFRRLINVPIAAAIGALLLLLIIGGSIQSSAVSNSDGAVRFPLASADRAAQARAAAFEARSQEALTLINRGNGAANEANWKRASDVVDRAISGGLGSNVGLPDGASAAFAVYSAHLEIRSLDDAGDWDQAVAVTLGAKKTPNSIDVVTTFDIFDHLVGQIATREGANASAQLSDAVGPLGMLRNIVFLAGLAIAVLVALGCGQRLKEYR